MRGNSGICARAIRRRVIHGTSEKKPTCGAVITGINLPSRGHSVLPMITMRSFCPVLHPHVVKNPSRFCDIDCGNQPIPIVGVSQPPVTHISNSNCINIASFSHWIIPWNFCTRDAPLSWDMTWNEDFLVNVARRDKTRLRVENWNLSLLHFWRSLGVLFPGKFVKKKKYYFLSLQRVVILREQFNMLLEWRKKSNFWKCGLEWYFEVPDQVLNTNCILRVVKGVEGGKNRLRGKNWILILYNF